jgi:hypothetical protein
VCVCGCVKICFEICFETDHCEEIHTSLQLDHAERRCGEKKGAVRRLVEGEKCRGVEKTVSEERDGKTLKSGKPPT